MGKEKVFKDNIAKDCFAYHKGRCRALTVKQCEGKGCSFYKTKQQLQQEKHLTFKRIKTLDKSTQLHIAESYYGNKMPWLKEEI